jgi:septum formation protein
MTPVIYLASASPRRSQLLLQIKVPHTVRPTDIDESRRNGEAPVDYVSRLAQEKAEVLWQSLREEERLPVLAADTAVVMGERVFGKPRDQADGIAMLQTLSGQTHQVYTAVALRNAPGCELRLSRSEVTFGKLSLQDCEAYWHSGEPADKAGGYAVQGLAATFITHIAGSYSGIMGLPLAETAELLCSLAWSSLAAEKHLEIVS